MLIYGLKGRGIGRFHDDFQLPIAQLGDARLVALVGVNGAGKTTATECVPGAIYRSMPSRASLARMAKGRDSFIELDVETTQRVLLRLMIDGVAKTPKTEGIITSNGEALAAGKLRDYEAVIERLFPGQDLFLASAFAVQGGRGAFLSLSPAERKTMFVKMLGAARLQELSDAAAARLSTAESELSKIRGCVEELERSTADAGNLKAKLEIAYADRGVAHVVLHKAEEELAAARAKSEAFAAGDAEARQRIAVANQKLDAAIRERKQRDAAVRNALDKVIEITHRIEALTKRLEYRDALEVAAMEASPLEEEVTSAELRQKEVEAARLADQQAVAAWERSCAEIAKRGADLNTELAKARAELFTVESWVEDAKKSEAALGKVPCGGAGEFAGCHLIAAAVEKRKLLAEKLLQVGEATERVNVATRAIAVARQKYQDERAKKPQARMLPDFTAKIQELRRRLKDAQASATQLAALDEVATEKAMREVELGAARGAVEDATAEVANVSAEVQLAEDALKEATIARELRGSASSTTVFEMNVQTARNKEKIAETEVAKLEQRVTEAEAVGTRLAEARAAVNSKLADVDDWKHLRDAFGKSGIQALEIDAAGPEVSTLTNRLLHACYGGRFTVSLETQQLKADGKSSKEVFDLRVIDSQEGTDGSASELSGGEKVIVSEALALAIAIYNCERSSIPLKTLFRDECSGALSSANAGRYVEMLRRAIELGGFHRVYFVAHQPELWALADKRILFEDGQCKVE